MLYFTELYTSAYLLIIHGSNTLFLDSALQNTPTNPKISSGKKRYRAFIDFCVRKAGSFVADNKGIVSRVACIWAELHQHHITEPNVQHCQFKLVLVVPVINGKMCP